MAEENNKFIRRSECERVHDLLGIRLKKIEEGIDKVATGVSEGAATLTTLKTKFNDELDEAVAARSSWGAYKIMLVVSIINILFSVFMRVAWP